MDPILATDTIVLTPNWEGTTEWFALALRDHSFDRGAKEPIVSFIEQVRYLALTNPEALERVIKKMIS